MLGHLVVALQEPRIFGTLVVGTFGYLGGEAFLLTFQVVEGAEGREGLLEDGAHTVGHHLLRQVAHRLARGDDEGAALRLLPATENLEEGGLAGTVHAHETYTVVVADVEGDVVKEVGAGELYRQIIYTDHDKKKGAAEIPYCSCCFTTLDFVI